MNKIVEIQLNYVTKTLAEQDIKLTVTHKAIDWLSQLGFDPQFGARPVKRVIQKQVLNELSKAILAGKVRKEQSIQLDMFENKLVFINQNQPAEISAN
jgi:ATP-dependent Clp protease ATP-binding subunit ClpB